MANIGGPKGPSDPTSGARILALRPRIAGSGEKAADKADKAPEKAPEKADRAPEEAPEAKADVAGRLGPVDKAGSLQVTQRPLRLELPERSVFDPAAGRDTALPPEPIARGGGVRARLAALGVKGAEALPIKTAARDGVRLKDTPIGKILDGSLTIESPRGLQKLEGVVRVTGDLVIQESASKSADLLALRSLAEIGGRLTIEGNHALVALDALASLERARGIYIGFNPALQKLSLPRLKELDAALILEGNPALVDIQLPAFQRSARYLHVHDNASLVTLSVPALASLGDELSLVDNPRLANVKVAARDKPAEVGLVELRGNGAGAYPHLYVRVR